MKKVLNSLFILTSVLFIYSCSKENVIQTNTNCSVFYAWEFKMTKDMQSVLSSKLDSPTVCSPIKDTIVLYKNYTIKQDDTSKTILQYIGIKR